MAQEFSQEEIDEFKNEATELLDEAEKQLLGLENGGDFKKSYDAVFRVFHSLKGGAGMLGLNALQNHMHQLENQYQQCKSLTTLPKEVISYFLRGVDTARQIFDHNGETVAFDYTFPATKPVDKKAPASNPEQPKSASKPASKKEAVEPSGSSEAIQEAMAQLENAKVMLIDDEPEILDILAGIVTDAGFQVVSFVDPQEAVKNLATEKPEVILTDYKMPNVSGLDVLKLSEKYDADLPVVFISGNLSKEIILDALAHNVYGAIEKPFSTAQVIATCTNAIQRYRLVKLLNKTISFIYYQYPDLDEYLKKHGEQSIRASMQAQFKTLVETRRKLKFLSKQHIS